MLPLLNHKVLDTQIDYLVTYLPRGRKCPIGSPGALGKSNFGGKGISILWSFGNFIIDPFLVANATVIRRIKTERQLKSTLILKSLQWYVRAKSYDQISSYYNNDQKNRSATQQFIRLLTRFCQRGIVRTKWHKHYFYLQKSYAA